MVKVTYAESDLKIKNENQKAWVFDGIRKKWVIITPEEWVRQNLLHFLVGTKKYPASLIAVEKEIVLSGLQKRCDIVIYKDAAPWMIVECKEINTPLSEHVLRQVIHYNMAIPCKYLVISNGSTHYIFHCEQGDLKEISDFPDYC